MRILAVRQTVRAPMKTGGRQPAWLLSTRAGFLLLSISLLVIGPAGATRASADEGLCGAISSPSAQDQPNDPETVCGCTRDYLKHVGQAVTAVRSRAQELVGKGFTQTELNQKYFDKGGFAGLDFYTGREYRDGGAFPTISHWSDLLQGYIDGRGTLACTRWASDKGKLAELQKQKETLEKDQENAKAANDAAVAQRQAAFAKQQQALRDLTEQIKALATRPKEPDSGSNSGNSKAACSRQWR